MAALIVGKMLSVLERLLKASKLSKQGPGGIPIGLDASEEFLIEMGLSAGKEVDGVLVAKNMCASKGSMDIFIEPYLCEPELLITISIKRHLITVQE